VARAKTRDTYKMSTTSRISNESRNPSPKNAGPAEPVPKARMLKLAVNQSKNICQIRLSVLCSGRTGAMLERVAITGVSRLMHSAKRTRAFQHHSAEETL